jgi:hypothetical protein
MSDITINLLLLVAQVFFVISLTAKLIIIVGSFS